MQGPQQVGGEHEAAFENRHDKEVLGLGPRRWLRLASSLRFAMAASSKRTRDASGPGWSYILPTNEQSRLASIFALNQRQCQGSVSDIRFRRSPFQREPDLDRTPLCRRRRQARPEPGRLAILEAGTRRRHGPAVDGLVLRVAHLDFDRRYRDGGARHTDHVALL